MQAMHSPTLKPSPLDPFRTRNRSPFLVGAASKSRRRVCVVASKSKREKDPKKRVVITGMGLVSVFGNDVDAYYDRLLCGESGISVIDRFDASKFRTRFGGQIRGFCSEGYVNPKDDKRLDDCCRYCIVAGKRALQDANLGGYHRSKVILFCFFFCFREIIYWL